MKISPRFGARVRQAREDAGLSQTEVADQLGLKYQSVQSWEKGVVPPPRYHTRLAEILGVDPPEFFRWIAEAHEDMGRNTQRENADLKKEIGKAHAALTEAAARFDAGLSEINRFSDTYQSFHASYERMGRQLDELAGQMAQIMQYLFGPQPGASDMP